MNNLMHEENFGGWGGFDIYSFDGKKFKASYDTEKEICLIEKEIGKDDWGDILWEEVTRLNIPIMEVDGETQPNDEVMERNIFDALKEEIKIEKNN